MRNRISKVQASDNLTNEKRWFRLRHIHSGHMSITVASESTYIERGAWKQAETHVCFEKRIDFALELISKSKLLASFGYRNNAIVDSVIALEIALNGFGNNPDIAKIQEGYESSPRVKLYDLKNTIKRLGFSTSVGFLLPLIISQVILDTSTLNDIDALITQRQNIIHNGTRHVNKTKMFHMLKSAEKLTNTLMELTIKK